MQAVVSAEGQNGVQEAVGYAEDVAAAAEKESRVRLPLALSENVAAKWAAELDDDELFAISDAHDHTGRVIFPSTHAHAAAPHVLSPASLHKHSIVAMTGPIQTPRQGRGGQELSLEERIMCMHGRPRDQCMDCNMTLQGTKMAPLTPDTVSILESGAVPPSEPKPSANASPTKHRTYADLAADDHWGEFGFEGDPSIGMTADLARMMGVMHMGGVQGSPLAESSRPAFDTSLGDGPGAGLLDSSGPAVHVSPKKRAEVSHATFLNWETHSVGKQHEQQLTSSLSKDDLVALCRRYLDSARRCKRLKPWPDQDNEILHLRRVVTIHANVPTLVTVSGMDMGNLCTRIAQLFYKHQNDFPQSIAFYELSIVNSMRSHGKDSLEVAASRNNVAIVLSASAKKDKSFNERNTLWEGKAKDALNHFHAALAIRAQVLGATDPQVANVLQGMGSVWVMIGGLPKAIWCLDRCVKARLITLGVAHPATKQAHRLLADTLMARGTAIYQANTTRYNTAAAVEALDHPSDPKPSDPAPAPEVTASTEPAGLPLKYQTTLEGALDHFHRVFFIRSECLGENDMGTVAARVAVEDCVKAMVDKKEEHARVTARLEKAKLRAAQIERFSPRPRPAETVINPHTKHAKHAKDVSTATATATATATGTPTSPASPLPGTGKGAKKGGRRTPGSPAPSPHAAGCPRGTSPDKRRPFEFT